MLVTTVRLNCTALLVTATVGIWSQLGGVQSAAAAEPNIPNVKELMKERLATLKKLADVTTADYKAGRVSFDRVHQAMRAVLEAELELCDLDKERVTILENAVKLAKEYETVAEAQYRTGKVTQGDLLMAKVNRLEADIALERAKAKLPITPK